MSEFLQRSWEMLIGRTTGPMAMRLILQPSVATLLAVRAGLRDAKQGRTPYLWSIFHTPRGQRRTLVGEGWRQVKKVFLMAVSLDVIYQIREFRWVYPLQILIVAVILAIMPYLVVRGVTGRLAARRQPGG